MPIVQKLADMDVAISKRSFFFALKSGHRRYGAHVLPYTSDGSETGGLGHYIQASFRTWIKQ